MPNVVTLSTNQRDQHTQTLSHQKEAMHRVLLAAVLSITSAHALAQTGPAWAWSVGKISNNGAVSIKSAAGAGTLNAVQNPLGAVAKTNQSAVTQPPTVIVQATASLPIKAVGDSCVATSTGTSPNSSANEGTAVLADRSSLLTCQAGKWAKPVSTGSPIPNYGGQYILGNYCVMHNEYTGACSCPTGYTAVEVGRFAAGFYYYSFRCNKT